MQINRQGLWTPDGLTQTWRLARSRWLDSLAAKGRGHFAVLYFFALVSLGLMGLGIIFAAQNLFFAVWKPPPSFFTKLSYVFVYVCLAHLFLIPSFIYGRATTRNFIWIFSFILTGYVGIAGFGSLSPRETLLCVVWNLAGFFLLIMIFKFSKKFQLRRRLSLLFFTSVLLTFISVRLYSSFHFFVYSWYFVHARWFLVFSLIALEDRLNPAAESHNFFAFFSPANFLDPLPASRKDWQRTSAFDPSLFIRGWFDLISSFVAIFLLLAVGSFSLYKLWLPVHGLVNYLILFLISYSTVTIPVGLLRLYGFQMKDAFDLPLLAATPYDRWRRWNTFYYHWFYAVVFWPVFKKTRNLAITCITVFLVTFWFHSSYLLMMIGSRDWTPQLGNIVLGCFAFFMAHALAVYIGLRLHHLWPKGNRLSGWWGVLVTWMMMIAIHSIDWW